jgi:hypothetical protein
MNEKPCATPTTETQSREIDLDCALRVMRWTRVSKLALCEYPERFYVVPDGQVFVYRNRRLIEPFAPTKNMKDAGELLKRCAERCTVTIQKSKNQLGDEQFMVARLSEYGGEYVEDFCKCEPTLELALAQFALQLFPLTKEAR